MIIIAFFFGFGFPCFLQRLFPALWKFLREMGVVWKGVDVDLADNRREMGAEYLCFSWNSSCSLKTKGFRVNLIRKGEALEN
jgi:hypothetical protein